MVPECQFAIVFSDVFGGGVPGEAEAFVIVSNHGIVTYAERWLYENTSIIRSEQIRPRYADEC